MPELLLFSLFTVDLENIFNAKTLVNQRLYMHHGMEVRLGLSKGPICPSFI
ncbi:unnamed protein product [Lupinus luteus]|uniref:Uncharacterized protein n=1 Tax=Lupinus luteus TaxID=3873 RepID=A0AAV1VR31_LUPLU